MQERLSTVESSSGTHPEVRATVLSTGDAKTFMCAWHVYLYFELEKEFGHTSSLIMCTVSRFNLLEPAESALILYQGFFHG